ncbi:protein Daple-like [Myotis yumanensis]|uniref:protein Daple-like n=1 Tax=Myotis yumanensis TaxID=159337 RepID=UPI0038D3A43A
MRPIRQFEMGGMEFAVQSRRMWSWWCGVGCVQSVCEESVCEESVEVESVDVESVRAESVKAPNLEATVRKFDDVCKKGSEGKECDNLFTIIAHLIRFMLEKMLVLKDNDMQRVLGYDPEPVEKLRKLQRALDRGHIPQRFLEELLGDSMALKAEQVQRMNQPAHLSWEMEQLSEASNRILENQTLQGVFQEMRGASVAQQDSSLRCTELQEENQQLQKQKEQLEMELLKEKNSSQEWETLTEELVKALEQLLNEVDTLKVDRAIQTFTGAGSFDLQKEKWEMLLHKEKEKTQKMETINKVQYQALLDEHSRYKTLLHRSLEIESKAFRRREQDQLQHEAAIQELRDLVSTQREALKQAAQEERLPQEERVNFWNQLMIAEPKELHTQSKVMQSSPEVLQQEVMLWQAQYKGAKEDLHRMEISLKKLSSQCEVLSHEKENFQEEKVKLKRKIQTLARRNRKLLKENEEGKTRRI